MSPDPANDLTGAMTDLADALLDFQARPGRYAVALREPRVLFERITEVLALASGRSVEGLPADPQAVDALRDAARFFVRTALLRPGADHFTLLGLSPVFDPATLREHYRMLIRMTHPDFASAAGVAWPADAATRINLANDVLSSDERREAYAQSLQRPRNTGGPAPAPARWAKDPWQAEPSGKRWPTVAVGVGMAALLGFWLWPSQTPQERLARLAAEAQEQETAAQQAAKDAQPTQVAVAGRATAAQTPSTRTQTPPATSAKTPVPADASLASLPATRGPAAQPMPPTPSSTLAQVRPASMPAPAPAPSRVTAAPETVALAEGEAAPKRSPATRLSPQRTADARPGPMAPPAAVLELPARMTAAPAQAATARRTLASPTPAPAAVAAPSPEVAVAAVSAPPAASPAAAAPVPAAQSHGVAGAVPTPTQTVVAALPPVATFSPSPALVATAQATPAPAPVPAPAPAPDRIAAIQPAPASAVTRNAGNSPRMSEVQPLLNQLLGALQSGRGDAAVRLIDSMARQNGAGAGFPEAYERTLGGRRLLRIGQVRFAGRPADDQLVVDGVLQLQVQTDGEDMAAASREFILRAAFVSRGGKPVLTQLSPAGASR